MKTKTHEKVLHGLCPDCGHYGEDCLGSTTTHTPTPWRIYKEPMNPNPRIMAEASTLVAVISQGKAFAKETDANAAFIVRAVNAHEELIRALKTAVELLSDARLVMDKDREDNLNEWLPSIEQAIAKAEGK